MRMGRFICPITPLGDSCLGIVARFSRESNIIGIFWFRFLNARTIFFTGMSLISLSSRIKSMLLRWLCTWFKASLPLSST